MLENERVYPSDTSQLSIDDETITRRDVLVTIEMFCWLTLAFIPLLRWVSGDSVSEDQYVIRCMLTGFATIGAVISLAYRILRCQVLI